MIALLVLAMNYNHPFSSEGRFYFATTPITPTVGGRVIEVPVTPNAPLKAGDVLFRLDPERYQNTVKAKEAQLADAAQATKQLQSAAETAKKNSDAVGSARDAAKDLYDRSKPLLDKGVISQVQFKQTEEKFFAAQSQAQAARAEAERAALDASAAIGGVNTDVARLQAELDSARYDLDQTVMRAPTDGVVVQLFLRPGMYAVPMPMRPVMVFMHKEAPSFAGAFLQNSSQRIIEGADAEVTQHEFTMNVTTLGEPRFDSHHSHTVSDEIRIPEHIEAGADPGIQFELAGPRKKLFFDPKRTRVGIVTCGGLCPGLNNVIRSLVLELHYGYGVGAILGFRGGYTGLDPEASRGPVELTPELVDDIHRKGGTILGTSRGPVDTGRAVENLIAHGVDILFTLGGDGTQRGANDIYQEACRRGLSLSVVGVPKTIDNDVGFVSRTFGFSSAVEEAVRVLDRAHTEARSVTGGVSLVKLMGRHAGFITAAATVASQDVNYALIPEVPFVMESFLASLKRRSVLAATGQPERFA